MARLKHMLLGCVVCFAVSPLRGEIIFVPDDVMTLDAAFEISAPGDTIVARRGTYYGPYRIPAHNLTVAGEYFLTGDPADIDSTIVQPDPANPFTGCFETLPSVSPSVILNVIGWTIRDGRQIEGVGGGGIRIQKRKALLDHCKFKACLGTYGGAIRSDSSRLTLKDCSIVACDALWTSRVLYAVGGSVDMFSTHIGASAYLSPPSRENGEIHISGCSFTMTDCSVRGVGQSEGRTTFVTVSGRAGFECFRLVRCAFEHNVFSKVMWGGMTGGMREFLMDSCRFESNELAFGFFDSMEYDSLSEIRIIDNLFQGTTIPANTSGVGPFALGGRPGQYLRMEGNAFFNNRGGAYSCIYLYGEHDPASFHVNRNYFLGNSNFNVASPPGGAVFTSGLSAGVFEYNSLTFNHGQAFDTWEFGSVAYALHNWWGDSTGPFVAVDHEEGLGDTTDSDTIYDEWLESESDIPDTSLYPDAARELPTISSSWHVERTYPNPFNSEIRIELSGWTGPAFQIRLFDLLGREVEVLHEGRRLFGSIVYSAPPTLAVGVYFLQAYDGLHSETRKVLFLK